MGQPQGHSGLSLLSYLNVLVDGQGQGCRRGMEHKRMTLVIELASLQA